MSTNRIKKWHAFDDFKLTVSIILVILLIPLFFRSGRVVPPPPTISVPTTTTPTSTATPTSTPSATPSFTPTATYTPTPTITYTFTPTGTSTSTPTLTYTPTPTATYTPTPTVPSDLCALAPPTELKKGDTVKIANADGLYLRKEAGRKTEVVVLNQQNTLLEIKGNSECIVAYLNRVYRWWPVEVISGTNKGKEGWSAESYLGGEQFLKVVSPTPTSTLTPSPAMTAGLTMTPTPKK